MSAAESFNLIDNLDKLHTTDMGIVRIKRNLHIDTDVVEYCKGKIADKNCFLSRRGKNFYCEVDGIVITVNAYSFTIITAHAVKP